MVLKVGYSIVEKVQCCKMHFDKVGTFRQLCIFNKSSRRQIMNPSRLQSLENFRFGCNKLNRIFITHLHGDHIFGLPSVILGINFEKNPEQLRESPVYLYGPSGLGNFISNCFDVCESRIQCKLDITELCLPDQPCSTLPASGINKDCITVRALYPNDKFEWNCVSEDFGSVLAGNVSHNITTFGYSYFEKDQPGNVNADIVIPLLQKNKSEIEKTGRTIYDVLRCFKVYIY